jgi:hypothetical protein
MMNFLAKLIISIVAFLLTLVPVWLYLLIRHLFSPEGFWQNFVLMALMILSLWPIQIFLLIVFLKCLTIIWFDN